jgi:hypothetical protein
MADILTNEKQLSKALSTQVRTAEGRAQRKVRKKEMDNFPLLVT